MPDANTVAPAAWIEKSNQHAQLVLEMLARFHPEVGSMFGMPGVDERVIDLGPGIDDREFAVMRETESALQKRLGTENDTQVKQDLEIMLDLVARSIEMHVASRAILLPYRHLAETIYRGLRTVLDHQNAPERQRSGLPRLRRYAGLEPGSTPVAHEAIARWREKAKDPKLIGPARAEVEKNLGDATALLDGLAPMFEAAKIGGYEPALAELRKQMSEYEAFVRGEVLARARPSFRQPGELYRIGLKNVGVDMALEELVEPGAGRVPRDPAGDAGHRAAGRARAGPRDVRLP